VLGRRGSKRGGRVRGRRMFSRPVQTYFGETSGHADVRKKHRLHSGQHKVKNRLDAGAGRRRARPPPLDRATGHPRALAPHRQDIWGTMGGLRREPTPLRSPGSPAIWRGSATSTRVDPAEKPFDPVRRPRAVGAELTEFDLNPLSRFVGRQPKGSGASGRRCHSIGRRNSAEVGATLLGIVRFPPRRMRRARESGKPEGRRCPNR